MIATWIVASGLPPQAFGVEPSAVLGEHVIAVLAERAKAERREATMAGLRR